MSRALALLEELTSQRRVWQCAVVATITLASASSYWQSYVEELVGVFREDDGRPIPYIVLEGETRSPELRYIPRYQYGKASKVKIVFPCPEPPSNFVVKIKRICYNGCDSGVYTVKLSKKGERRLFTTMHDDHYEIKENFAIPMEGREEWIATMIRQIIDAVILETSANPSKVVEILCKQLCRG